VTAREGFLEAAASARSLIAQDAVGARWDDPSALAGMTIGSLAGHLARGVFTVAEYTELDPPPPDAPRVDPAQYFQQVPLDPDAPIHADIRARAVAEGKGGQTVLLARLDAAIGQCATSFERLSPERTVAVRGGYAMTLDEYLVTRLIELAVHLDDLAVSIDAETPEVDAESNDAVLGALLDIARLRHGDLQVLRAFARRERDSGRGVQAF
jgi:hypothetical protein